MFHVLDSIDRKLRARVEKVAITAAKCGDGAIVEWAVRASADAVALGRVRDKDIETLKRLEDTYGHEFYANAVRGNLVHS